MMPKMSLANSFENAAVKNTYIADIVVHLDKNVFAKRRVNNQMQVGRVEKRSQPKSTYADRRDVVRTVQSGNACDYESTGKALFGNAERAAGIKVELCDGLLHGIEKRHAFRIITRTFDMAFSATALVLFSWRYAIVAIAVQVDDPKGPVFPNSEGQVCMARIPTF